MKIILKSITTKGFGAIPDTFINFYNNKNTTAFLAHNGYGKTSIINAIKTAISGNKNYLAGRDKSGRDNQYDENKVFKDWLESNKNKSFSATFDCVLVVDDQEWTHSFTMNKAQKEVEFSTKIPNEGAENKYTVHEKLKPYLKSNFLELIFFDPTKTTRIFDEESDFNAEECIRRFCDLNTIQKSIEDIDDYSSMRINSLKKKYGGSEKANAAKKLDNLKKKYENMLIQRKKELKEHLNIKNQKIKESEEKLKRLKELQTKNNDNKTQLQNIEKEIKSLEKDTENNLNLIFKSTTDNPFLVIKSLKEDIAELVNYFHDHQIPEQDATLLVDHILKNKECICGDKLDEPKIKKIKDFKETIATTVNVITFINNIKSGYENDVRKKEEINITEIIENTRKFEKEITKLQQRKDLIGEEEDMDLISDLQAEIAHINNEIKNLNALIYRYEKKEISADDMHENTENIEALKRLIEQTEEQYNDQEEITEYIDFRKEMRNLLDTSLKDALVLISEQIKDLCNQRINNDYKDKNLEIKEVSKTIIFDSKSGGSSGEEATVAYLFILSLIEKTNIKFPLIIDNPTVYMDSVSKKAILQLIPMSDVQKVFFMYDDERVNYADKFEEFNPKQNNYILCSRKLDGAYKSVVDEFKKIKKENDFETESSIVCYNEEFFLKAEFPQTKSQDVK